MIYPSMERLAVLDRGGHFLASEDPHRFCAELRETSAHTDNLRGK